MQISLKQRYIAASCSERADINNSLIFQRHLLPQDTNDPFPPLLCIHHHHKYWHCCLFQQITRRPWTRYGSAMPIQCDCRRKPAKVCYYLLQCLATCYSVAATPPFVYLFLCKLTWRWAAAIWSVAAAVALAADAHIELVTAIYPHLFI